MYMYSITVLFKIFDVNNTKYFIPRFTALKINSGSVQQTFHTHMHLQSSNELELIVVLPHEDASQTEPCHLGQHYTAHTHIAAPLIGQRHE